MKAILSNLTLLLIFLGVFSLLSNVFCTHQLLLGILIRRMSTEMFKNVYDSRYRNGFVCSVILNIGQQVHRTKG